MSSGARQELDGSRAGGLHSLTIEVLHPRGIADRFLSEGQTYPVVLFNMMRLDISDFPTRHNYMLGLRQNHIERILANWVEELGVPIYRSRDVIGFCRTTPASVSNCPTATLYARNISSGVTEGAGSYAKQPASTFPVGLPR